MKFALSLLFLAPLAQAFTLNSQTTDIMGWSNSNVQLQVNPANCPAGIDVPGIISAAADVWNNAPNSSLKVTYGGTTTNTTYSAPTAVYCETNFQSVTGADQNYVPGAASVGYVGGRIAAGILYLNASAGSANIANYDLKTLKIILAHEIGHILGLGHSATRNALMYFDGSDKKVMSLAQDDIDGIAYLYPTDESQDKKFAGCGLVKTPRPPTAGPWLLALLLLPITLVLRLRQRGA